MAQVVAKWADHQPLYRQEKMFERHGIDISRKTMGGSLAQCAELLDPLYQLMKKELLNSKVIGTDDTSVKVMDRRLPFAMMARRSFWKDTQGYLQAPAYSVYDAFFKSARGMTEVGCWMIRGAGTDRANP